MKDAFALADDQPPYASYPPFDPRYLRAIELAVRQAWDQLRTDPVQVAKLASANEVEISHQLRDALNGLREQRTGTVRGYTCEVFERPQLGAEILTLHGKVRKPDLVFALSGKPRPGVVDGMRDAIYVECKIIEKGKGVAAYCHQGLRRFVDGEYGAYMREGMMLAYVRNMHELPRPLTKLGKRAAFRESLAWDGTTAPCDLTQEAPRVYLTVHQRQWPYSSEGGTPGPIKVRHLWLSTAQKQNANE